MSTPSSFPTRRTPKMATEKELDKRTESYSYRMFGCFNRKFKMNELGPPKDVQEAFIRYSENGKQMMVDQLYRFLIEFQGEEDCSESDARSIMEAVLHRRHPSEDTSSTQGFNIDDFFHFLFFDDLNGPIKTMVHHDMMAPLPHYFIYTGHNSYLTGNQLSSDCSDVPIIKALQRGVRGIELDLWPNSTKDDINVLHGRTLTTPVPLFRCLKSIKEYGFVKSPYPVIITLEDHLTPELQAKVAKMATEVFGEQLYIPDSACNKNFPSPEALKHRFILSTKPPKEYLESQSSKGNVSRNGRQEKRHVSPKGWEEKRQVSPNGREEENRHVSPNGREEKGQVRPIVKGSSEEDVYAPDSLGELLGLDVLSDSDDQDEEVGDVPDRKAHSPAAPEYKRLIALHAGKPKNGSREALTTPTESVRRLSLSEHALEKATSSQGTDVLRFTQKNVLRVYPKGTRVTSSNYHPFIGWIHGAQMIAFNMQGYGKFLWMMHGLFRSNGECGYVRKPDFLMRTGPNKEVFDPKKTLPVKTTFKVTVYLGDGWRLDFSQTHFDAYSPPDFYTKVHIIGVPADEGKKKTRIIPDDWAPVWNEEFTYALTVPELALLRIEVREHDRSEKDDFGGQTCLPISEIKPGIRAVPLFDKKGDKYKSVRLLVRFQFL